jgi:hypothetical protein
MYSESRYSTNVLRKRAWDEHAFWGSTVINTSPVPEVAFVHARGKLVKGFTNLEVRENLVEEVTA